VELTSRKLVAKCYNILIDELSDEEYERLFSLNAKKTEPEKLQLKEEKRLAKIEAERVEKIEAELRARARNKSNKEAIKTLLIHLSIEDLTSEDDVVALAHLGKGSIIVSIAQQFVDKGYVTDKQEGVILQTSVRLRKQKEKING